MTRVVHFGYADNLPGAARASYRIHRGLREWGLDSRMVVAARSTDDPTVTGPTGRRRQVQTRLAVAVERRLGDRFLHDRNEASLAITGTGLVRQVTALRPDVVTLHWIAGGLVRPSGLRHLATLPVVWRLADMWPLAGVDHYTAGSTEPRDGYRGRDLDAWAWRRKRLAIASLSNLTIVSPSHWLASQAADSIMFRGRRIETIATGTDLHLYAPHDRNLARKALGLPLDRSIVLFGAVASTTNRRKGAEQLTAALRLLATGGEASPDLVVFGSTDAGLRQTGLHVHTLGRVSDEKQLALAYAAADVFVAPSLEENLANTVLESLATGTPVVAFDVGGMPDAIDHRRTGWLAAAEDAAGLAAGIRHFLALPTLQSTMVRELARSAAEERFDAHRQAGRWKNLYEELLAPTRRPDV